MSHGNMKIAGYFLAMMICCFWLIGCDNSSGPSATTPQVLSSPARFAAVGDGSEIVVTDYSEDKFCLVDKSTLAVNNCFAAKGQPTGVVYADYDSGRYYVGNKSVGSVDIYNRQGVFIGHLGGRTNLFGSVYDLDLDPVNQHIYVLDSKEKVIRIF